MGRLCFTSHLKYKLLAKSCHFKKNVRVRFSAPTERTEAYPLVAEIPKQKKKKKGNVLAFDN